MDNLNENKFIKINTQHTIFDNIIKELKEKINNNIKNKNKNEIYLYYRKLYNKENEKYDKLLINIIYKKTIKPIKEYNFSIIIDETFPKNPPVIYCDSLDINICLNDKRDLFYSIIENNWLINETKNNYIDILSNIIIIKIPQFILRLLFYEENKILIYYGNYKINEIYNINNFLVNKNIILLKVMTYKKEKETSKYSEINMKYIIITDIYILFFELLKDMPKNIAKLIFIGEIFQYNSIERLDVDINLNLNNNIMKNQNNNYNDEDNNKIIDIDPQKYFIDWIINDKSYSFIFSIINEINDNKKKNIIKNYNNNNNNEIIDFINIVNKKQNIISSKYKLVINDYNQIKSMNSSFESLDEFNNNILNNLIQLSKFLEKLHTKIISKNNENLKEKEEKNLINNEINKIYNKIIDISTKINKIEITFDYLDKLENKNIESYKNKRINLYNNYENSHENKDKINNNFNNDKNENKNIKDNINSTNYNMPFNYEKQSKENKLYNNKVTENEINKSKNILINNKDNSNKNLNSSNTITIKNNNNKNNNDKKNNKEDKSFISNKTYIKNEIKQNPNNNINTNINNKTKERNSIYSLAKMFENKKV